MSLPQLRILLLCPSPVTGFSVCEHGGLGRSPEFRLALAGTLGVPACPVSCRHIDGP